MTNEKCARGVGIDERRRWRWTRDNDSHGHRWRRTRDNYGSHSHLRRCIGSHASGAATASAATPATRTRGPSSSICLRIARSPSTCTRSRGRSCRRCPPTSPFHTHTHTHTSQELAIREALPHQDLREGRRRDSGGGHARDGAAARRRIEEHGLGHRRARRTTTTDDGDEDDAQRKRCGKS